MAVRPLFMSSLPRSANLFLLFTYLALSAVPFLPFLMDSKFSDPMPNPGMELVIWVLVWAVFKRPAFFHWLLLPAFFALPVELYLHAYYHQGIAPHHLGIIAETSPKEALEFLGSKAWILLAVLVILIAWWGLSWKAALGTRALDWTGKSRWLALGLFATVLSAGFYSRQTEVHAASDPMHAAIPMPALPAWSRFAAESSSLSKTWPFGPIVHGYDFWQERRYLSRLADKSSQFEFGARQTSRADLPQVVVMVIGESSRYDRWSLNGYQRQTNPLLEKEANLVSFSNMITSVSATRLSVPVLMSRKPAVQSLQAGFAEKSFLSAFNEAGFKTFWLSNQMTFGQFDTPVSVYANEADVTQFLNLGGLAANSSHDQVLLDPLKNAIGDPAPKKLIVLHTLGSHWNYSQRHPKEYDKWQPSLFGVASPAYTDLKLKTPLNNSYDNSILYTDWFLSQVIGALKSSAQLTSMMYVSDHGQTLYDGNCMLAFHGHNTEYEFHVPALVWYSDLYQAVFSDKVNQLRRHKRSRLSTENVFHSLLDMADIHYASEQLERSFVSMQFKPHKRYVDSYGWADYDNATFKGDCREVIDNGKPLLRAQ